jgi:ribosome-binding protein aMBF1 (putative translation factor)
MTQAIKSLAASSRRTHFFERFVGQTGVLAGAATVAQPCAVFQCEDHAAAMPEVPAAHQSIGDLVSNWSKDETRRVALEQARAWVADTFHAEDGDTVRTLRLSKGWSQTQLANELGTSQPHVARIERGTENVTIETCRRLCRVLGIDMNMLDAALRRQEALRAGTAK